MSDKIRKLIRDAYQNAIDVFSEEPNADQCREVAEYMREVLLAATTAPPVRVGNCYAYQDAEGAIPVTCVGQPVGLLEPITTALVSQEPVAWMCDVLQADGSLKRELSFEAPPADGVTYSIRGRTPLYTTARAAERSDIVIVPRQLLEDAATWLEAYSPGSGSEESYTAQDLRTILAGG